MHLSLSCLLFTAPWWFVICFHEFLPYFAPLNCWANWYCTTFMLAWNMNFWNLCMSLNYVYMLHHASLPATWICLLYMHVLLNHFVSILKPAWTWNLCIFEMNSMLIWTVHYNSSTTLSMLPCVLTNWCCIESWIWTDHTCLCAC